MTGRQENTLKLEAKIKSMVKSAPDLVQRYSHNFSGKTASTAEAYIRYVMKFAEFFSGKDLTSLRKSDINYYMESIKYRTVDGKLVEASASIRNSKLAAIKDFYSFLVDEEIIENNPAASIKPPKPAGLKEPTYLTPEEIKSVEKSIRTWQPKDIRGGFRGENFSNRDLAIFMLACTTGLRVGAITEINIDDVDFKKRTIRIVEKGNKTHIAFVGKETMNVVNKWILDRSKLNVTSDALFVSKSGKRMARANVYDMIKKYTGHLTKEISPHKLRSTCATNLYEQTNDIYLVQEVLGHSNIANTRRYAKVTDAKQKKAADILDKLV